nr:hypothetical protein [Cellulosimicrobium sp. MM]
MLQGIGGAFFAVALTGMVVVGIVRFVSGAEARARRSEGAGESASSGMFGEIVEIFQPSRTHLTEEKERQRLDIVQRSGGGPAVRRRPGRRGLLRPSGAVPRRLPGT